MWNYSFEMPTLMILGIILAFYFSRPRLPIRRNRAFVMMIVIETLSIISDVVATAMDSSYQMFPVFLLTLVNCVYFIVFFFRAYLMYLFTVSVMKDMLQKTTVIKHLVRLPLTIGVFASLISFFASEKFPWAVFYIDKDGYHAGKLYVLLYICGFFYVFMSFLSSYLFRNSLGRRREKISMLMYNLIICAALIVRFALPEYLIFDTFVLMAILIVYLAFMNPEYFLDLKGAAFNAPGLREHLEENIFDLPLVPFGVAVHSFLEMRDVYGSAQMDEGIMLIGKYLKQVFPGGMVFYMRNGRFIVLATAETDFDQKSRTIAERFYMPWIAHMTELYLSPGFAIFENVKGGYAFDVFVNTLAYALRKVGETEDETILHVTEDDLKQTERELAVRKNIEYAIDNDGLEMYLQPIADAKTGEIIGAESLSRIRDAEGNIIPPGLFIPVAEHSGRINILGEIAFEKACRFIRDKGLEKTGIHWINVNLSPAQFMRSDLAARFSAIADEYGIDPGTVHLEITEGSMIDDTFLQRQMNAMGEKGFKFVLDDYGTGYSNLSRLKKCPFINVKLDMSIVWDYCKEPGTLIPNMVTAFKNMGFGVTAEGIEDEAMAALMNATGCDLLQGYHYSKPIPEAEFIEKYRRA